MPSRDEGDLAASARVAAAMSVWLADHRQQSSRVLVACSGGADSLALAAAVLRVAGDRTLAAATVDHGLQQGSAGRAADTVELLRAMGFAHASALTVTVDREGGMEAAARRARYRALAEFAEAECGGAAVLLAHTQDDQAETVLLGLSRGSGPRSIAGMRPWRAPWGRPLLGLRRADTEAACVAAGLPVWQDPHNSDPAFTRVRLRTEVLPLLDGVLGGGVVPALARTADLLQDDLVALDELADRALAQSLGPDRALDCEALLPWPAGVRRRVLRLWAGTGFGVEAGGTVIALTADHLWRLDALVTAGRAGSSVRLPGARDVVRRAGRLVIPPAGGGRLTPDDPKATQRSPVTGTDHISTRPLTTVLTSDDARPVTLGDADPAAPHGYQGELAATLIDADTLRHKIADLAQAVASDHTFDTPPLLVCVLKGAVMFLTDFARALPIPAELEFMAVSSYGSATSSSGVVRILKDLDRDISGRRVVIVEDIIDSGLTLSWLGRYLASRGPATIDIVALLRKPDAVKVDIDVRYVGFDIPTEFVVGYGLDYAERYRDLPFVGLLAERMYR